MPSSKFITGMEILFYLMKFLSCKYITLIWLMKMSHIMAKKIQWFYNDWCLYFCFYSLPIWKYPQ